MLIQLNYIQMKKKFKTPPPQQVYTKAGKVNADDLNDMMVETVVLSSMLVDRFETMHSEGLPAQKAKMATKNAYNHLVGYVAKIFNVDLEDVETKEHFKDGTDSIFLMIQRADKALKNENLSTVDDRLSIIEQILDNHTELDFDQKSSLVELIRQSEALRI